MSYSKTESSRFQIFVRVWAGFGLLLFASTWKLWTPQTDFPQIPFFEFLIDVPGLVDWFAITGVVVSLAICMVATSSNRTRLALGAFVLASCVLIVLNQHRLQPWAYQFVAFAIIMATTSPNSAMKWMRWIAISIYIYSAISKFDYQFIHTVGDQILWGLADKFAIDSNTWPAEARKWIVLAFPTVELVVGIGLIIVPFRRHFLRLTILMHIAIFLSLIFNFGGLSVLFWNLYFIAQAVFLFGPAKKSFKNREPEKTESVEANPVYPLSSLATSIALFVLVFPTTEPIGLCDHWPAWQVYAPRTSRASVGPLFKLDGDTTSDPPYTSLPTWSLSSVNAPLYPQARFQIAVLIASQQKGDAARKHTIDVFSKADRWNGSRYTTTIAGDQYQMHVRRYRLNTKPRFFWSAESTHYWRMEEDKRRVRGGRKDALRSK